MNIGVIGDVIAVIAQGRREKRKKPEAGNAQVLQIIQFLRQAFEIADAVVVAVEEGLDVSLINDGVFEPQRVRCASVNFIAIPRQQVLTNVGRFNVRLARLMFFPRSSGILLHPTSLPGPFGMGDLGPEARRFADFLASAGQTLWQVLPLGPTGFGDSPYQCFSAFAGNPLLISLEDLGLAISSHPIFARTRWISRASFRGRWRRSKRRHASFAKRASALERQRFEDFCDENAGWLDDFALFMALKQRDPSRVWSQWDEDIRARDPRAIKLWRVRVGGADRHTEISAVYVFLPVERVARLLPRTRHSHHGRSADLCRARQRGCLGQSPIFSA